MERLFLKRWIVVLVLGLTCLFALRPASLQAAVVPVQATSAGGNLALILDNPQVMSRLAVLGYSRSQVKEALANLSPADRATLAEKANSLVAGGDGVGVLLFIVLIVVVIAIVLQATGHRLTIDTKAGN